MRIYNINPINFTGQRQDRKAVAQLSQNNGYDLNLINQRRINKAIESLSETPDNIDFLIDVSENLKYGTNIDLGKTPYNDWRVKLNDAIKKSYQRAPEDVRKRVADRLASLSDKKPLTQDEREIMALRKDLLEKIDYDALDKIPSDNIKNLPVNLDYFIISSEIPTVQKLYILKRLNYFMSEDYKIDPQLKDRKTQALAEIVNDIVVDTPESKIPNIKSINQRSHGMCAAISICRKSLAYEDKANYVDMVMSELDDKPYMMVYDITKLGTHTKIQAPKTGIDFDYALSRGYRIVDASALYWMHIADTDFAKNEPVGSYLAFDKTFFDTFHDSHIMPDISDELAANQDYYRVLLKSKETIGQCKKNAILKEYNQNVTRNRNDNYSRIEKYNKELSHLLLEISPELSTEKKQQIISDLKRLEVRSSKAAEQVSDYTRSFVYLPNEANAAKTEKIKAFLAISLENKNEKKLNRNAPVIFELVQTIRDIESPDTLPIPKGRQKAKSLYEAAAAYRTQVMFRTEIASELIDMMINSGIPDRETLMADNINMLIQKLEIASKAENEKKEISKTQLKKAKLSDELLHGLAKNLETEPDPEMLKAALEENLETLNYITTERLDDFYKAALLTDRKTYLKNTVLSYKQAIESGDSTALDELAIKLRTEPDKKIILDILDNHLKTLSSDNLTNDEYIAIYNEVGNKNQMKDFSEVYNNLGDFMFNKRNQNMIAAFNKQNGLDENAPLEETLNVFREIGKEFNEMSIATTVLQNMLEVRTDDGQILNTASPKGIILKGLENQGDIISERDLRAFQTKFNRIESILEGYDGIRQEKNSLPDELKTFTPYEKTVLKQIENNINAWYKQTTRALDLQYKQLEEPLSELHRKVGVKTGEKYVHTEGDSGLWGRQQVKIIEHMTDRPYYIEENTRLGLKKLKESPYSGISATSVSDTEQANHAQYISDIRTVQIKGVRGEVTEKEVFFHDNTWGAAEHENVWVDKNGMLRTDYSNEYGGKLGYITDGRYQTGKFVDQMSGKYGTVTPKDINSRKYRRLVKGYDYEYTYPMFVHIIMSGESPTADSYVRSIRDNTLINPVWYFDDLTQAAKDMSYTDVQNTIHKTEFIAQGLYENCNNLIVKILGKPPFNNGIKTQKDYDKLPDNDNLKIILEQIALIESYSEITDTKLFYKEFSIQEQGKIRETLRQNARNNFIYSFGKNPDIIIYGAESVRKDFSAELQDFAKENGIKIIPSESNKIINSLKKISKKSFDGSLNKTTELMSESFAKSLYNKTPDFENKKEKIEALRQKVQKSLYDNMIFNDKDLKEAESGNGTYLNVYKWIDKVFDPKTDEEFVNVYRKLQNMTTKDFEKLYGSKINDIDLEVKNTTGFDILTRIRANDAKTGRTLLNTLYARELGRQLKLTPTKPIYNYNKTQKIVRGFIYPEGKRTFDDIYYDYYWSLYTLTMQDYYAKFRKTYFSEYGVFPAYPKIEYEDFDEVKKALNSFISEINDSIDNIHSYKDQQTSMKIASQLYKYTSKIEDNNVLTNRQISYISTKLKEFINLNGNDDSIPETNNAICAILKLPNDAPASEYKKQAKIIYDEISFMTGTTNGKLEDNAVVKAINTELEKINTNKKDFIKHIFAKKYHTKAYNGINHYIQAKMNGSKDAENILVDEFTSLYDKHRLTKEPDQMLNEYLLRICKSKSGETNKATKENIDKIKAEIETLEKAGSDDAKIKLDNLNQELETLEEEYSVTNTFAEELKALLDCANTLSLEEILMDCADEANLNIVREKFKNSTIQLNNGKIVKMNSPEAMNMMILPYLIEGNHELAMNITEQLGLQEEVAKMIIKSSKLDNVRKTIIRIDNIFLALSAQNRYMREELAKLGDIDNDPNYVEKLEQLRTNLKNKYMKTNYRKTIVLMDNAINFALREMKANPNESRIAFLNIYLNSAKDASMYLANTEVQKMNDQLRQFEKISNFAKKLNLPKGSETETVIQDYLKKIEELDKLTMQHSRAYPELGIATIATNGEQET